MTWKRRPKDRPGEYFFSGLTYLTRGVAELFTAADIAVLREDLRRFVQEMDGVDYVQIYDHLESGQVVYCIDQLSEPMKNSGRYSEKEIEAYGYNTILLREEY